MPISRLEALLTERGLTSFQPHHELGDAGTEFEGLMLQANGLRLYWGTRTCLPADPVEEIRLLLDDGKLVVLVSKHQNFDDPNIVFGHPQTPGVNAFTDLYETPPTPPFPVLLAKVATYIAHPPDW